MARFTGTGTFTIQGTDTRIYDCEMQNAQTVQGALIVTGTRGRVENCTIFNTEVGLLVAAPDVVVTHCYISVDRVGVNVTHARARIANNRIIVTDPDPSGHGVLLNSASDQHVIGNYITIHDNGYGIEATDGAVIQDNVVEVTGTQSAGIVVLGNDILVENNKIRPVDGAAYGVWVSSVFSSCNIVVGNDLGDPSGYTVNALQDDGTDTILTYPNDPTYGDNFTGCGSPGSPGSP